MDIKILGSGHAYQTPNSDCGCNTCGTQRSSGDPRDSRTNTSIAVKGAGEDYLLIDCGPNYNQQKELLRGFVDRPVGTSVVDGMNILQTHSHHDHSTGLLDVDSGARESSPVPTYAHSECFRRLDEMGRGYLFQIGVLEKNVVEPGKNYEIGGLNVRPFKVEHSKAIAPGAVGFVIDSKDKRFVYTGDFGSMENPKSVISDDRPIDFLIAECNWFNALKGRDDHMSFQNLMPYIKAWAPNNIMLVHLGSDDERTPRDDPDKYKFKKDPVNPLPVTVPRTHVEWDSAVREVLRSDPELKRFADQDLPIISHDGLEVVASSF